MIVLHISGPPASGKTSLCRAIMMLCSKRRINFMYQRITGFHYLSYAYGFILLYLTYYSNATFRAKMLKLIKRYQLNPYDLIPLNLVKKHILLLFTFEVVSISFKILVTLIKRAFYRPRVVLIDEGIVNTALNYIAFFSSKNTTLWKPLLRVFLPLFRTICKDCLVILILPSIDEELNMWRSRGDLLSLSIVKRQIEAYRTVLNLILKIIPCYINVRTYIFRTNIEAIYFLGNYACHHSL